MPATDGPVYDAVVVHYRNAEVYGVVQSARAQSVPPRRVVVVDNSGDVDAVRLRSVDPTAVLIRSENRGYAAAVNEGVRALTSDAAPFVAILTHEVRLAESTLPLLLSALATDPTLGSAGPLLHLRSEPDRLFSGGGRLDRFARPSHVTPDRVDGGLRLVDWIDGSVMMLRREALQQVGLVDERYFLYFEEIDLAVRLRRAGWRTGVVRAAKAWQEPGEYPPYLAVRNRLIMLRANPWLLRGSRWLLYPRLLLEIAWAARRRGPRSVPASLRGLVDGSRGVVGVPAR